MKFPEYVPVVVCAEIQARIEGDSWNRHGWAASLASAEKAVADIERTIDETLRQSDQRCLDALRKQKAYAIEHRDKIKENVELLHRLVSHPDMRGAYDLLSTEFTSNEQWADFIFCAWVARANYADFRERYKRVNELKVEIADAATRLADLLDQFAENGVIAPDEFYSIPAILQRTSNLDPLWPGMSRYVFGDLASAAAENSAIDSKRHARAKSGRQTRFPKVVHRFIGRRDAVSSKVDEAEKQRAMLRYAWEKAPDLPAILRTVANAARDFTPEATGWVGAAIDSRKRNEKTEYLRAFATLLTKNKFSLNPPLSRAMAIVTAVVINDPDIEVSYDDVRKAALQVQRLTT